MSAISDKKMPNFHYQVESIKETDPPEGMTEGKWFSYVVGQGTSKITCIRSGTLEEITLHAESYVSDLNNRTSKGVSPYAQRSQKSTTPAKETV